MADEKKLHYNPDAPHKVVVLIRYENLEVLPDGRVGARPSSSDSFLLEFKGKTFEEAQKQAEDFTQGIKNEQKV